MTVIELPPTTDSVPAARRFVRAMMLDSDTDADIETATLLVTEIVTNAVLHALPRITLTVSVRPDVVRIEVHDGSEVLPRAHAFSSTAATGRGLRLLESLALRWGVSPEPGSGKIVWFEVGAASDSAWELAAEDWLGEGVPSAL